MLFTVLALLLLPALALMRRIALIHKKVPGYATVDLNAYWNINPNVKVFTNIENVGDAEYKTVYNFSNWYVNGGRQASVGVTFRY